MMKRKTKPTTAGTPEAFVEMPEVDFVSAKSCHCEHPKERGTTGLCRICGFAMPLPGL